VEMAQRFGVGCVEVLPLQNQTFVLLYLSQKKSRSANMPDVM